MFVFASNLIQPLARRSATSPMEAGRRGTSIEIGDCDQGPRSFIFCVKFDHARRSAAQRGFRWKHAGARPSQIHSYFASNTIDTERRFASMRIRIDAGRCWRFRGRVNALNATRVKTRFVFCVKCNRYVTPLRLDGDSNRPAIAAGCRTRSEPSTRPGWRIIRILPQI